MFANGDEVGWLAPAGKVLNRGKERLVRGSVEVVSFEYVNSFERGGFLDQHGTDGRLLGLDVVGRQYGVYCGQRGQKAGLYACAEVASGSPRESVTLRILRGLTLGKVSPDLRTFCPERFVGDNRPR